MPPTFSEEGDDGLLLTGFSLGEARFGVEARLVLEVVKTGELTPVHNAPQGVIGIRNLRGRIVTVVDMATQLGLGCVLPGPENRLLIMESEGETYGFLVDAVGDAIALDEERVDAPPASLAEAMRGRLRGVWHEGDRLTAILEPQALFQWEESGGAERRSR